jgi:L-rhamnose mutarotase
MGDGMKRFGMVVGLRPEHFEEYKRYHAAVWPEVEAMIKSCHIRNYTIYHHDGLLFASYEYYGTDHAADMARMAADPATQKWWAVMEPMQKQIQGTPSGEWWMPMEEMYHFDGPKG